MANEKELQLDSAEEEPKSKKKLIIIIVAVLLVVGIGAGAAIFLMSGDDPETEEVAEETTEGSEPEAAEPSSMPAIYVKLKPEFIVNYQVGSRQRYLQIYMEAMTRKPEVADALEMHSPMIRSSIISLLSQQEFEFLRSAEGRASIREQVTAEVQRLITQETGVEESSMKILFTNYVMQ